MAYDKTDQTRLVGGGQLFYPGRSPITEIGYWVTSGLKRSGYGSSILGELEKEAIDDFPCLERLELKINPHNMGSLALANAMGYEPLYIHEDGDLVFGKCLRK